MAVTMTISVRIMGLPESWLSRKPASGRDDPVTDIV
jgi:hypothetical protein